MAKIKAYISQENDGFVRNYADKNYLKPNEFINQVLGFSADLFRAYNASSVAELKEKLAIDSQRVAPQADPQEPAYETPQPPPPAAQAAKAPQPSKSSSKSTSSQPKAARSQLETDSKGGAALNSLMRKKKDA